MQEINIKDLEIKININELIKALKSYEKVVISLDGKLYENEEIIITQAIMCVINNKKIDLEKLSINELVENIFSSYKYIIKGNILIIYPLRVWQEIITLNQDRILFFDHQTDGVEFFEDKELEDIGWNANPCDVSYREISDFIEANCKGTLVYYDNGISFNGFVIVEDINDVRKRTKNFIIETIKEKLEKSLLDLDDDDIVESLEFFNIEV